MSDELMRLAERVLRLKLDSSSDSEFSMMRDEKRKIATELRALAGKSGRSAPHLSDADIAAWVERHDLGADFGSSLDARCAFEDAQTAHLLPEATTLDAARSAQGVKS